MQRAMTPPRVVGVMLAVVLGVVIVGNLGGSMPTDIKPEVYLAPGEMLGRYLSSWTSSPYLGSPNFNVGLVPVLVVTAALRAIGLSAAATYAVFHLALWLAAALGAARLLRSLHPNPGAWAPLAAGAAYVVNPYTIVGGSTLAIALPFALLPWLALAFVRALRSPRSWLWPATMALAFFAMSGMNVAVVPTLQLLIVIPIALVLRQSEGLTWRTTVWVVSKAALVVVAISTYWLWPAVAASGTGLQIVQSSETITGIARVSSLVEVLRGMGMWSLYGRGPDGPWIPQYAGYLDSPLVVLLTLAWPVVALLALHWTPLVLRRIAVLTAGIAAVVMVGVFPGSVISPVGSGLLALFNSVPLMTAFRTTNKIGALLALAFALALGSALPHWLRVQRLHPVRVILAWGVTVVLACSWVWPALTGGLYISRVDIPKYWSEAARALDSQSHASRVLLLPGQTRPRYRWTDERPDDVVNSIMSREAIIPETTPNTSAPGGNLLAALTDVVASGAASHSAVSTYAAYLGAREVLLRHDIVWDQAGGARPATTDGILSVDPGLTGLANFGRPGEQVMARGSDPVSAAESILPPLQVYGVKVGQDTVRARPAGSSVTIAGDGWALDALADSGVLDSRPVLRYAHDTPSTDFARVLGPTHRLVLTDTNRRQAVISNRLTAGQGPLLTAREQPTATRALGGADDQTVAVRTGPQVTASQVGGAFFDVPYGTAYNAVDGDPRTSWLFGDFRRAVGATLDVTLPEPQDLGHVTVRASAHGAVQIARVSVTAGGRTTSADVSADGTATLDLTGVRTDQLRLRVDELRGEGFSLVGIAEVELPGPVVQRSARLPLTLSQRYADLDARGRAAFAATPLDVALTRVRNGPLPDDDSETSLRRILQLPDRRTFDSTAEVRIDTLSESTYDQLRGADPDIVATSSQTWFDNPDVRASQAMDSDAGTAWVPGGDVATAWWQVRTPERAIPEVRIVQRRGDPASGAAQLVAEVAILVDGREVTRSEIGEGETTVGLPAGTRGRVLRVQVTDRRGLRESAPPRFPTIDSGVTLTLGRTQCLPVATVDGTPLLMRPVSVGDLAGRDEHGTSWRGCGPTRLTAGAHTVDPVPGVTLDRLLLRDERGAGEPALSGAGENIALRVRGAPTRMTVSVPAQRADYVLATGQGFDPRWRAETAGTDLGEPIVIDGHSTGWVVPAALAATDHEVHVTFAPDRGSRIAILVTASVVGLILAAWLWVLLRRWRPGSRGTEQGPSDGAQPDGSFPTEPGTSTPGAPAAQSAGQAVDHLGVRWVPAGLICAVAGLALGVPGAVGGVLWVALTRVPPSLRRVPVFAIGPAVLACAGILYVWVTRESWGEVDASAVSRSLWPHLVAGVGLVVALASAWQQNPQERSEP